MCPLSVTDTRPFVRGLYFAIINIASCINHTCYVHAASTWTTVFSSGKGVIHVHVFYKAPPVLTSNWSNALTELGKAAYVLQYTGIHSLLPAISAYIDQVLLLLQARGPGQNTLLAVIREVHLKYEQNVSFPYLIERCCHTVKVLTTWRKQITKLNNSFVMQNILNSARDISRPCCAANVMVALCDAEFILGTQGAIELIMLRAKIQYNNLTGTKMYDYKYCINCTIDVDLCLCIFAREERFQPQ